MKNHSLGKKYVLLLLIFSLIFGQVPISPKESGPVDGFGAVALAEEGDATVVTDAAVTQTPQVTPPVDLSKYVFSLKNENVTLNSTKKESHIIVNLGDSFNTLPEGLSYRVDYKLINDTTYSSVVATESAVTIEGLKQNKEYNVRVVTVAGEETTEALLKPEDTVNVITVPYRVSNFKVKERYNTELMLDWKANVSTEAAISYNIYISTDGNTFNFYANTSNTYYAVINLTKNTEYYFRIKATTNVANSIGQLVTLESPYVELLSNTTNADSLGNLLNLKVTAEKVSAVSLDWSAMKNADKYRIYRREKSELTFSYLKKVNKSEATDKTVDSGKTYYYRVEALNSETGAESTYAEVMAVAKPKAVKALDYKLTATSVAISWLPDSAYTGFLIYRYSPDTKKYVFYSTTTATSFLDTGVVSATNYRYAIRAYSETTDHISAKSDLIKISVLPDETTIKASKGGVLKARLKWKKVARSTGYFIYQVDAAGNYTKVKKIEGKKNIIATIEGLLPNTAYTYAVAAYKTAFGKDFVAKTTAPVTLTTIDAIATNTDAYKYKTKKKTLKSASWKKVASYANYKKSYIIPGIKNTDCNGYLSTSMCPQGFCIAKKFAVITAYDMNDEENSVLYVMNKKNHKLRTVITLPNAAHVGGICFDGEYLWVTSVKAVAAISLTRLKECVKSGLKSTTVEYDYECAALTTASFIAYHNEMLWVGTCLVDAPGTLNAYYISRDSSSGDFLTKAFTATIPSMVQGITFYNDYILLSRSMTASYVHQIEVYKPKKTGKETYSLGTLLKKINLPDMSEDIDISGKFLFVNFESAAYRKGTDMTDRVIALKLKKILKGVK